MRSNRLTNIALVGAAIAIAACAKEASNTTTDSAGGAMNADSSAMMSDANAAPAMTDANIAAYLDEVNIADSSAGKLASTKGTSKAVRDFGLMMAGEHHALRVEGLAVAKKGNITPAAAPGDTTKQMAEHGMAKLTSTPKGAAWDKAYIDNEIAVHESVLENATAASKATQNADVKALIEKAAPIVQKHLDRAKEIQKMLTPST